MTQSFYSENQSEIDAIDMFVSKKASIICTLIWAENVPITPENIFSILVQYIKNEKFQTSSELLHTLYKAMYFAIIKNMFLNIDDYPFPDHYSK